ncbi:hypothetical protein, partial [Gemmobacter sp.]|uniref:hypothetical protein n=1 Tax=Gemmobacter sp. TaxID=1898957 RepID=UPI0025C6D2E0
EASARPAGVKHPPPAGRALAGGFGPPAQTRKRLRVTSAMPSVNWVGVGWLTRWLWATGPIEERRRLTEALASAI